MSSDRIQAELEALRKQQITKSHRQNLNDQNGGPGLLGLEAFHGQQKQLRESDAKSRDEAKALLRGFKGVFIAGASEEDRRKIFREATKRRVSVREVAKEYGFENVQVHVDSSFEEIVTPENIGEDETHDDNCSNVVVKVLAAANETKKFEVENISSETEEVTKNCAVQLSIGSSQLSEKVPEEPVQSDLKEKLSMSPMTKLEATAALRRYPISGTPGARFPPEAGT